jgi:hypothetical protein
VNFFKDSRNDTSHAHNHDGLFLNNRQLSMVIAAFLLLCFCLFIAGYFWGQKSVLERFSNKAEQDSLADKISSSMYTLYDSKADSSLDVAESNDDTDESGDGTDQSDEQADDVSTQETEPDAVLQQSETKESVAHEARAQSEQKVKKYYAELIGFGSLHAAEQFVDRLAKKNISVHIKERMSKTAKGKNISWFQIVTNAAPADELEELVQRLKKDERLKGVRIVSC